MNPAKATAQASRAETGLTMPLAGCAKAAGFEVLITTVKNNSLSGNVWIATSFL